MIQESHPCRLQLEKFEGPMDLLLHLIKKEEIDIYDIPIARVTDQYLQYLSDLRSMNLDVEGEFLFMAATLVHIKSRMLLPRPPVGEDGETPEDPREELVQLLLEYQRFKAVGQYLTERAQLRQASWPRGQIGWDFVEEVAENTGDLTLYQLATAFFEILKEERPPSVELTQNLYTVEDKLAEFKKILAERDSIDFSEYFRGLSSRHEKIVSFLALLELARQAFLRIFQDSLFGGIRIVRADAAS